MLSIEMDSPPAPPKKVQLVIDNIGKKVKESKKRIKWTFCFGDDGHYHHVLLTHSVSSKSKVLVVDDRFINLPPELPVSTSVQSRAKALIASNYDWSYDFKVEGVSCSVSIPFKLQVNGIDFENLPRPDKFHTKDTCNIANKSVQLGSGRRASVGVTRRPTKSLPPKPFSPKVTVPPKKPTTEKKGTTPNYVQEPKVSPHKKTAPPADADYFGDTSNPRNNFKQPEISRQASFDPFEDNEGGEDAFDAGFASAAESNFFTPSLIAPSLSQSQQQNNFLGSQNMQQGNLFLPSPSAAPATVVPPEPSNPFVAPAPSNPFGAPMVISPQAVNGLKSKSFEGYPATSNLTLNNTATFNQPMKPQMHSTPTQPSMGLFDTPSFQQSSKPMQHCVPMYQGAPPSTQYMESTPQSTQYMGSPSQSMQYIGNPSQHGSEVETTPSADALVNLGRLEVNANVGKDKNRRNSGRNSLRNTVTQVQNASRLTNNARQPSRDAFSKLCSFEEPSRNFESPF